MLNIHRCNLNGLLSNPWCTLPTTACVRFLSLLAGQITTHEMSTTVGLDTIYRVLMTLHVEEWCWRHISLRLAAGPCARIFMIFTKLSVDEVFGQCPGSLVACLPMGIWIQCWPLQDYVLLWRPRKGFPGAPSISNSFERHDATLLNINIITIHNCCQVGLSLVCTAPINIE